MEDIAQMGADQLYAVLALCLLPFAAGLAIALFTLVYDKIRYALGSEETRLEIRRERWQDGKRMIP